MSGSDNVQGAHPCHAVAHEGVVAGHLHVQGAGQAVVGPHLEDVRAIGDVDDPQARPRVGHEGVTGLDHQLNRQARRVHRVQEDGRGGHRVAHVDGVNPRRRVGQVSRVPHQGDGLGEARRVQGLQDDRVQGVGDVHHVHARVTGGHEGQAVPGRRDHHAAAPSPGVATWLMGSSGSGEETETIWIRPSPVALV